MTSPIVYPETKRGNGIDTYHGVEIPDPYRWLEDPDSPKVKDWVEKQNNVTQKVISTCPHRQQIRERLTQTYNYEKFSSPRRHGNHYFFYKNDGLQNQDVIYMQATPDSKAEVFLDPNTLSEDGTAALNTTAFSKSGKLFAYGVSRSGSDWMTIYVPQKQCSVLWHT